MSARIAIIGHSAAGKSSCLDALGYRKSGDMDEALGVAEAPSVETFRAWLTAKETPAVVVLGIHANMLDRILCDRPGVGSPLGLFAQEQRANRATREVAPT